MDLMEFIHSSNKAANVEELRSLFISFIGEFGLEYFVMADMSHDSTDSREKHFSRVGNYPSEWLERYMANHYVNDDPVYLRGLITKDPVIWNDVLDENLSVRARRIMEEAAHFGLRNGVAFTIGRQVSGMVGFGFAGPDPDIGFTRETLNILRTAAYHFHLVYTDFLNSGTHDGLHHGLTAREREVILWIAHGKTKSDIAQILQVSESCVKRHCESVAKKLETDTLAHAVAKAIGLGLINP